MAEDRRDVGLLAVTSADRLNAAGPRRCEREKRGLIHARSHIERLLGDLPAIAASSRCSTAILPRSPGSARSTAIASGRSASSTSAKTGSLPDLYKHYGIDANAIIRRAQAIAPATSDPASARAGMTRLMAVEDSASHQARPGPPRRCDGWFRAVGAINRVIPARADAGSDVRAQWPARGDDGVGVDARSAYKRSGSDPVWPKCSTPSGGRDGR